MRSRGMRGVGIRARAAYILVLAGEQAGMLRRRQHGGSAEGAMCCRHRIAVNVCREESWRVPLVGLPLPARDRRVLCMQPAAPS